MGLKQGHKHTDAGVIPNDWEATSVEKIAARVRNAIVGGPFGSDLVSADYVRDGVPVIRGQNMSTRFVSGNFVFVSDAKANSLEANLARSGDLIFTQRGTLGQVSLVPDRPYQRYLVSQSQMKLTVNKEKADSRFFFYVFSSPEQQKVIRLNTIQTGIPHINLGILRSIKVQLPPRAEQKVIAEALNDADALIESLEQMLAKKRHLKQGAMQELLTGKKRLPGFERKLGYKQTEVGLIPEEWEVVTLGTLCRIAAGQDLLKSDYSPTSDNEHPFPIYSNALSNRGLYGYSTSSQYGPGCITVTARGDVGHATFRDSKFCAIGRLLVMTAVKPCDLRFVTEFINNFVVFALESTGVPQLTAPQISKYHVALPPTRAEQEAIADVLSDMDAEIEKLQTMVTKARQIREGMMQELLTGRIRLI